MSAVSRLSVSFAALALGLLCGCQVPVPNGPESDVAATASGAALETHYSPTENLEHYDLALIKSAHKSIDLCGFSFTDQAVGDALVNAANRGVRVRVYLDRSQSDGELKRASREPSPRHESSRPRAVEFADGFFTQSDEIPSNDGAVITRLASTPNIEVRIKHSRVLMHLKSYAVDGRTLRSGSANFSPGALKRQDNDLLLTRDTATVRRFELDFNQLWSRPDNERLQPQS